MKRRLIWWAAILAALALLANAGAAAAYFYDSTQADVIPQGVAIGGVDVGGLTRANADERLRTALLPRLHRSLTLEYRGRHFRIDPARAGLSVDVERMVDEAVATGRTGNLLGRFVRELRDNSVEATIPLRVEYSAESVDRFVAEIATGLDRKPVSGRVVPGPASLAVHRARWGVEVRRDELVRELQRLLVDPAASRTIPIPVRALKPKVTTADLFRRYGTFITVDREHFRLHLWKHLKHAKAFTIAVGRAGLETPAGLYSIFDKQVNPSWHVPKSAWAGDLAGRVIPPGPADPIKARWLGFYNGAGVHGTDVLSSLGTAASHGCIRMSIPDVVQLYDQVPLGTPIYVG